MTIFSDLQYGLRLMRRAPLITGMGIFCLAAGVGLSTFMFSITHAIVGRGLPFPEQEKIITVMQRNAQAGENDRSAVPVADFRDIQEQQSHFQYLGAATGDIVTVGLPNLPKLKTGTYVTREIFDVMPVQALMGRTFTSEDVQAGASPVILLSYGTWQSDFEGDPDIIGTECISEGKPVTIVGVMPKGYEFPFGNSQVWLPLIPETLVEQTGWIDSAVLLGRLKDGSTIDDANAELSGIFERMHALREGADSPPMQASLQPMMELFIGKQIRIMMWSMFGATLLVLLIACTNVSSLLIARLTSRENELAIRSALGADRKRIVVQILSESLLTAFFGTVVGLLVAWKSLQLLWSHLASFSSPPPSFMEFKLEPISILVATILMIISVVIASLLPAIRASRPNLSKLLNDSGRTSSNLRMSKLGTISPILQLAFSLTLLVSAGRLIYGIIIITTASYPFDKDDLLIGSVSIDSESYPENEDQRLFWEDLHRELQQITEAESISIGFNLPALSSMRDRIEIPGETYLTEADQPIVQFDVVTPGYFETLGVSMLKGRDFDSRDIKGNESVAIINETMAQRFWPNEDPLDRVFKTSDVGNLSEEERLHRVVGIVPDLAMQGLFNTEEDGSGFYRAQSQSLWGDQKILVRSSMDSGATIASVQKAIAALNPNIALTNAQRFENHVSDAFFYYRFFLNLFSVFGGMALILAATGVFGIIQYVVSQRVSEIGIRVALGAKASNIQWLILRKGIINAVIGISIGAVLSVGLNQIVGQTFSFIEKEYYSYAIGIIVLFSVTVLANYIPARKASKMSPMEALRI